MPAGEIEEKKTKRSDTECALEGKEQVCFVFSICIIFVLNSAIEYRCKDGRKKCMVR